MSGEREVQVGWLGPYGIVPGGMDVDPAPHWRPVYVKVPDPECPSCSPAGVQVVVQPDRCPTCRSDDPARQQGLPHTDLHAQVRCRDPWHSAPPVEENPDDR